MIELGRVRINTRMTDFQLELLVRSSFVIRGSDQHEAPIEAQKASRMSWAEKIPSCILWNRQVSYFVVQTKGPDDSYIIWMESVERL